MERRPSPIAPEFVPSTDIDQVTNDTREPEADKDSQIPEDEKYGLPFFLSSLFATILEDCITQTRILLGCNTQLDMMKGQVDMGRLITLKFDIEQPKYKNELEDIDVKNIGCSDYKINKLDADRNYLKNVIVASYRDMATNRSFKSLAVQVQLTLNRVNYYLVLLEEETKNRATRRELGKQLRQLRNHVKSVYYDTDCIIGELKTKVEDSALNAETCCRYVNGWQRARTEQNDEAIRWRESVPSTQTEYYKQRCDHEHRVHTEIDLLVSISISETLAKVESWMDKFDTDIEAMDLKIQIMKAKHVVMVEKREDLEKTIEKHGELIKSWVDFKTARENARLYREKMNNAATSVQAWWRGLLVRNQLGPYKPPPKRRGPPDKGKKK